MSIDAMLVAIDTFRDKESGIGATPVELGRAERQLAVTLPNSYRRFLRIYGWARFAHTEIYGIGANVPLHLDLISNAISERTVMLPLMPLHLIPVMNDGAGNHYCLNTQVFHDGDCPLVFWDHELDSDQLPEQLAPGFDSWLGDLLDRLSK